MTHPIITPEMIEKAAIALSEHKYPDDDWDLQGSRFKRIFKERATCALESAFSELKPQVDHRLKESVRLLEWAAKDFARNGISNDNWYADYEFFMHDLPAKLFAKGDQDA